MFKELATKSNWAIDFFRVVIILLNDTHLAAGLWMLHLCVVTVQDVKL